MTAYFLRRLLLVIPTFIGVTLIAFLITRLVPGGPLERELMQIQMGAAGAGGEAVGGAFGGGVEIPEEARKQLEKEFGLDKPFVVAYFLWLGRVCTLDFGTSYNYREPVWSLISERFPISLMFGLTGFLLGYLVCVPLGIAKALRHGHPFDFVSSFIVFVGYSIPAWAMGTLLLVVFASGQFLDWFPLGGIHSHSFDELPAIVRDNVDRDAVMDDFDELDWEKLPFIDKVIDVGNHMALPVFCYMMGSFATLTILMKNSLLENLGHDYVRTAFAKGLSPTRVIYLHTLRNSLIPLATGLGHALSLLMAGSYLIEWVFNIDGIGYLGYTSILGRDYTVVMGILAINTILTLVGNIISDVLYAMIDPRIRFQ
ncbi:Inner membrane ABC transporter permease protein YejB [Planctomycetes bacterium Pan216]|uniref:Inner membrane ABC transporter permease protein YejB n=1 Tax=Kolteria novifilia TaxID=2527975 RepID=A0A518B7I4_9BACT|nr:Inner membrane ABC transporter permease protein YejB [Planctomycetes bacterium Pan216]